MDPLSIIAGVAGITTAGSALASTLFDIISSIRDAPREMIDIARGIRELSTILRELRGILKQGRSLFKDRLFRAIRSTTRRIEDIHDEIHNLLELDGGNMARVFWAFRKSKTTKLLAKIVSHKATVQLIATTMLLAVEKRKYNDERTKDGAKSSEIESDHDELRREAETLIQVAEEAGKDLLVQVGENLQEDKGTQVNFDTEHETFDEQPPEQCIVPRNRQLQWLDKPGEDTARWLYELVFRESQLPHARTSSSSNVGIIDQPAKSRVLDGLLQSWTTLMDEDTTDAIPARRLREEDCDAPEEANETLPSRGRDGRARGKRKEYRHRHWHTSRCAGNTSRRARNTTSEEDDEYPYTESGSSWSDSDSPSDTGSLRNTGAGSPQTVSGQNNRLDLGQGGQLAMLHISIGSININY